MKHRSVHELDGLARVVPEIPDPVRAIRRARLERFAGLLDECEGRVPLLTRIEYMSKPVREAMRMDGSPLAIAFGDPVFRAQGLASDSLGEVMRFFELSWGETHQLFCDCHYGTMAVAPDAVADRVRRVGRKQSFAELWFKIRCGLDRHWRG